MGPKSSAAVGPNRAPTARTKEPLPSKEADKNNKCFVERRLRTLALTPEQRSQIARKAAKTRWAKVKKKR